MQAKYSVVNHLVGTVQIDHVTGAVSWDEQNLDPLIKRYVKKYLFDEGFIDQALGKLDPAIDPETNAWVKALMDS
jgi:hypothetical protein